MPKFSVKLLIWRQCNRSTNIKWSLLHASVYRYLCNANGACQLKWFYVGISMRHNKALTSFLGRHCSLPSSYWQFEMIAGTRKIIISILVRLTAINSTPRRRICCIENIIGITRGVTALEDQMILDDYGNLPKNAELLMFSYFRKEWNV